MNYRIMFDYGTEGFNLQDENFDTVDAAVKHAVSLRNTCPFIIVRIIDWQASEPNTLISNGTMTIKQPYDYNHIALCGDSSKDGGISIAP